MTERAGPREARKRGAALIINNSTVIFDSILGITLLLPLSLLLLCLSLSLFSLLV